MGTGYLFKCKNCKKRYSVQLGIGFLFPKVYRETLETIDNGMYDEEMQKLFRETPYAAVDAERELFICDNCGNWKVDANLSLYARNDIELLKRRSYGEKAVEELGHEPCVMRFDLEENYHLIREYSHICSKCGNVMKKNSDIIPSMLLCPKCGTENEVANLMQWD